MIDLVSIFPFQIVFGSNVSYNKLLRLMRLPKFVRILDVSKFEMLLDIFLENKSRQEKMTLLYAAKYVYKVIRLVLIAVFLTYFLGCLWYFVVSSDPLNYGDNRFYVAYELERL